MKQASRRIFKSRWFDRFAAKEGISDDARREAVKRLERGQIDADLGAGVFKQRVARSGQGRSGGYRTIILFRQRQRAVFIYGFPKHARANVSAVEARDFRQAAKIVLALNDADLAARLLRRDLVEVDNYGDEVQD